MSTDKVFCTLDNYVIFGNLETWKDPCSHEETDSRVVVHVAETAYTYNSITTRTVDSNVVVFAVNAFGDLNSSLN